MFYQYIETIWLGCETISIQMDFVFPFAETRSIKLMWRQLTERMFAFETDYSFYFCPFFILLICIHGQIQCRLILIDCLTTAIKYLVLSEVMVVAVDR